VIKEVDSTSKYETDEQYNAPPSLDDIIDLKKQFKTWIPVPEGVCLVPYSVDSVEFGVPAK
jgi:hypothetical protein